MSRAFKTKDLLLKYTVKGFKVSENLIQMLSLKAINLHHDNFFSLSPSFFPVIDTHNFPWQMF